MQVSISSIMQFIMQNPKAFPGWPLTAVFDMIHLEFNRGNIALAIEDGKITGLLIFEVSKEIFYIKHLTAQTKMALKYFIIYYRRLCDKGQLIIGQRRGKNKQYTERVFNLLLKLR